MNALDRWNNHKGACPHCSDMKRLCFKGSALRLIATTTDREHTQPADPVPFPDEIVRALRHAEQWLEYLHGDSAFADITGRFVCDESEDYLYDYRVFRGKPHFVFLLSLYRSYPKKEQFMIVTVTTTGNITRLVRVNYAAGITCQRVDFAPENIAKAML